MSDEQKNEARFIAAVKRELDRSTEALDTLTVARLRRARLRALDAGARPRTWLIAGGLATATLGAALVAVLVFAPAAAPPLASLEQFDLLSENDSLDLYEDLDFYRWLAARTDAG